MGSHLAARLAADGHRLVCLVHRRRGEEVGRLEELGAVTVPGDIRNADAVAAAAAGCDAFIHLVGIILERRDATFENIHVRGTLNALGAAAAGGIPRFLHMSALGSRADAATAYHRTKWQAEELVRKSGLDYTIFRPSLIIGPGGEFAEMLLGQARRLPVVPVIGDGNYRLQPITVTDVAACFSRALANDEAVGRSFDLGGPRAVTYNELAAAAGRVMGRERPLLHLPLPLMRALAAAAERLLPRPPLTTDQLTMLLEGSTCDITDMQEVLGVDPAQLEEGLKAAARRLI